MIFDITENLGIYRSVLPQLSSVVELLSDPSCDLTEGAHATDVPGLRYNVSEYITTDQPKEYEIHTRAVDVQVILAGEERIASAPRRLTESAGFYDAVKDIAMVQGCSNADIVLKAGEFAIYFPGEPHKPGLAVDSPRAVRKVVFKIDV